MAHQGLLWLSWEPRSRIPLFSSMKRQIEFVILSQDKKNGGKNAKADSEPLLIGHLPINNNKGQCLLLTLLKTSTKKITRGCHETKFSVETNSLNVIWNRFQTKNGGNELGF